jgi:hypothetical protein
VGGEGGVSYYGLTKEIGRLKILPQLEIMFLWVGGGGASDDTCLAKGKSLEDNL